MLFSFLFTVVVRTFNVDVKYKYLLEGKPVCLMRNCARLATRRQPVGNPSATRHPAFYFYFTPLFEAHVMMMTECNLTCLELMA